MHAGRRGRSYSGHPIPKAFCRGYTLVAYRSLCEPLRRRTGYHNSQRSDRVWRGMGATDATGLTPYLNGSRQCDRECRRADQSKGKQSIQPSCRTLPAYGRTILVLPWPVRAQAPATLWLNRLGMPRLSRNIHPAAITSSYAVRRAANIGWLSDTMHSLFTCPSARLPPA